MQTEVNCGCYSLLCVIIGSANHGSAYMKQSAAMQIAAPQFALPLVPLVASVDGI